MRVGLLLLFLAACGDSGVSPDAAADGGPILDDGGGPPVPVLPTLPTLTPCRAGWREVAGEEGVTLCDPWPATGRRDDCGADEAHFPGTPGCARVGTTCPVDGWPADLPTDRIIIYVDANALPGGNGATKATAYQSIGAATDAAPSGSVIAIKTGHYDEGEVYVGVGMTLWGACVASTLVGSSAASTNHGVLFLAESGAGARNLSVESPERLGFVLAGSSVTITDVVIHAARHIGIGGFDGTATLDHVAVRGTRDGRGIEVQTALSLQLQSVRVDDSTDIGIGVEGAGARLTANDLAVVHTAVGANPLSGQALAIAHAAQVTLGGVVLEESGVGSVYVTDVGTTLDATDLVVRHDTSPTTTSALFVLNGATANVSRALVEDQRGAAFAPENAGTVVTVSDTVVRDLQDIGAGEGGRAVDVIDAANAVVDRMLVARPSDGALAANDPGSTIDARDIVVIDAVGTPDGEFGRGIVVYRGGVVTAERVRIERALDIAIIASGIGSTVDAREVTVTDVLGKPMDGYYGMAAWAELSGHLTLTNALITRARLVGAGGIEGGVLTLDGTTIRDTRAATCGTTTCMDRPGGFAIAAPFGGVVTATNFVVDGAELCGVVVGETTEFSGAASMDLHSGAITRVPVGACVQVDGYDSARLRDRVQYQGVAIPLQATSYVLPSSAPAP